MAGYGRRALVETIGRYKALIGTRLHSRSDAGRRTEAAVGTAVLNRMLKARRPSARSTCQSTPPSACVPCVDISGFSLRAAVRCGTDERQVLEQLVAISPVRRWPRSGRSATPPGKRCRGSGPRGATASNV